MNEARRWIEGLLFDQANFDPIQETLEQAVKEVVDTREKGGSFEIIVRWYSENEAMKGQKRIATDKCGRVAVNSLKTQRQDIRADARRVKRRSRDRKGKSDESYYAGAARADAHWMRDGI
jgi:hypothetical protein